MVSFAIGDTVTFRASIKDDCFVTNNFYTIADINCAVGQPALNVYPFSCLNPDNVQIEFQWTNASGSTEQKTCTQAQVLKVLGSANTNNQGMAEIQYTITQSDVDLYNNNSALFDLRACIRNNPNTEPLNFSNVRRNFQQSDQNIILSTISSTHVFEIGLVPHSWYNKNSAADWIIQNIAELNGKIANIFSSITDWQYVSTDVGIKDEYVVIRIYLNQLSQSSSVPLIPAIPWTGLLIVAAVVILITVGIPAYFSFVSRVTGITQQGQTWTREEVTKLIIVDVVDSSIIECDKNFLPVDPIGWGRCIKSVVCGSQNVLADKVIGDKYKVDCVSLNTDQHFESCITQYQTDNDLEKYKACILTAAKQDRPAIINAAVEKQLEGCLVKFPFTNSCMLFQADLLYAGIAGIVLIGGYWYFTGGSRELNKLMRQREDYYPQDIERSKHYKSR
jgi:hypothetical protein